MKNFDIFNPVKIIFGSGAFSGAGKEAKKLGKKAAVITGKSSAKKTGLLDKLAKQLEKEGIGYVVYSEVTPNPKVSEVNEAAELAREDGSDFIIGLGGGSALDAAKGVAVVAKNGGSLWDYIAMPGKKAEQIKGALPILLIPTLAATGSEGNPAAVFTNADTNEKSAIYNPGCIYPAVSIVDPETTVTVPKKPTSEGIIDVIMHVLEEYLTGETDCELQDRLTEGIIHTCMQNGYKLMNNPEDLQAREQVSLSSTVALQGIPNSGRAGSWVVHPMEHAVSGMYDSVAHGSGISALLPAYLKFLGEIKPDKIIQLSKRIFGTPDEVNDYVHVDICIKGFRNFIRDLELPLTLKEQGVKEEDIDKLVEKVVTVSGMPHPKLNKDRLRQIFREAYSD